MKFDGDCGLPGRNSAKGLRVEEPEIPFWYHLHLVSFSHDFLLPRLVFLVTFHISFSFSFELYRAQAARRFTGRRYCNIFASRLFLLFPFLIVLFSGNRPFPFFPLLFCFCLAGVPMGSGFDTILHRSSFLPIWKRVWSSVFFCFRSVEGELAQNAVRHQFMSHRLSSQFNFHIPTSIIP